jgi:hypothetical protein
MPLIPRGYFDSVFFLYDSLKAAEEGLNNGCTGFLVGMRSEVSPIAGHIYAVTNKHCLPPEKSQKARYARFNRQDGTTEVIKIENHDWIRHPNGDDVAISNTHFPLDQFNFNLIDRDIFATHEVIEENYIGAGDEVFMIGRFFLHEGKDQNIPSARFGNISMMPLQPIINKDHFPQESYMVEMRSIQGYSGSPVFVYILPFVKRTGISGDNFTPYGVRGPWLLGINWGHLYGDFEKVYFQDKDMTTVAPTAYYIQSTTSMAGVVPAWKILDLLDLEVFKTERENGEAELRAQIPDGAAIYDSTKTDESA